MREFHLEMKPDWLVYCKHNTGEGGYEAIKRLWQSGARPQAIAAANEPIALGIMRFLYEQDIGFFVFCFRGYKTFGFRRIRR